MNLINPYIESTTVLFDSKVVVSNIELFIVVARLILQEDVNRIWTVGPDKGGLWSRVVLDALCGGTAVLSSQ